MTNEFGLDAAYFRKKLQGVLNSLDHYAPDELARELRRLSETADCERDSEVRRVAQQCLGYFKARNLGAKADMLERSLSKILGSNAK